jgi:hypothetical protein
MASKYPKMSKQGTAVKRKHATLTISQKLKLIRMLKNGKRTNYGHLWHQVQV